MKYALLGILSIFGFLSPIKANAYDWSVVGKVTFIEPTYAPNQLPFKIDTGNASCPAGALLSWNPQGTDSASKIANYNAILSVLLISKSTGQSVDVFVNNSGCTVTYIHLQ